VPNLPLTVLDETTASATARFSDRSKFGTARVWIPDITTYDPSATDGWPVVVRLHGGNGNNQGDLDPGANAELLLLLLNELGAVIVSINWQDNGFYEPSAQDPRALFFPDGLLEPAQVLSWLVSRFDDPALFGPRGFVTRDPARMAAYGLSDGGWRAAWLAYAPGIDLGTQGEPKPAIQPGVAIVSQGHLDIEHFWMTEPSDGIEDWRTKSATPQGATQVVLEGGSGSWKTGHELAFQLQGETNYEYLVTHANGARLTLWPALRASIPVGTPVFAWDNGVSKYSKGGYSWLGAPMFRAGTGQTWNGFPLDRKRAASLWTLIRAENPRVAQVSTILLFTAAEPYVTFDQDPISGWRAFLASTGTNPRYKNLHAELNAYVLAGLLGDLGHTQGTSPSDRYLMRAGGPRTNPDPATRFTGIQGPTAAAILEFLRGRGW
jgi:hypothetical protein